MIKYLKLKKSNCKNCYKCIRHCYVKSIIFSEEQANIINDECILCGQCFIVCPQNAKEVRFDVPAAKQLLEGPDPVYVSLAPSFIANYDNINILSMAKVLKKLGFAEVEETAIGATIVKKEYDREVAERNVTISSCCHSINLLIQKYFPKALQYLSHVVTPMYAHCMDIKRRNPNAKTVFIGPCISKKAEAETYPGVVDCVLTFEELSLWLEEEGIEIESLEEEKSDKSKARFFPVTGGILKSMDADNPDYTYLSIDGIENCANALKEIINGKVSKCFIEMSACHNSCVGGPVMDKTHRNRVSDYVAVGKYAGKKDFDVFNYQNSDLQKRMSSLEKRHIYFSDDAIEEVLRKIGKKTVEDELNCGGCGYNTCRDKARAVIEGKANLEMCLPFLNAKAKSFSDHIINNTPNAIVVTNEQLEIQQINISACELMNIKAASDVLGSQVISILDPTPFINVLYDKKDINQNKIYLPECHKYVTQTIIYDKNYHILIAVMRDITDEVKHKSSKEELSLRTIEVADKVIEKQMRTVQEIASLLGETTAETKVALTRLKESLYEE